MRTTRWLLSALAIGLVAWSCNKDNSTDSGSTDSGGTTPAAPTTITLSTESLSAERTGGGFSLTVKAPSRPGIASKPDWVTVQDGTYNNYQITYTLKVEAYGEYGSREGTLTVKSGSLTKDVTIVQKGREKPEVTNTDIASTLVTTGATTKAQALYDYLLANYGKKIISSVMADVNWNTTVAQKVYQQAGKYPAMNCFDFIQVYVPDGNGWINYNDITPVTSWAEAGGIVSLMWHFNVPKSETTTIGTDGSGVTCTTSETTFKASNALKDGTWESKWYKENLEKVATIILALQEKGIAAIWRPYHEAAGNYYALKYTGSAWFWWGAEGPETFKALWNDMFDYFKGKGIKNLIWVWTAQGYNGSMSEYDSDEAYYPGDDKVDVVARDLYGYNAASNGVEFALLQNTYNHKMITLGECGWGNNGATAFSSVSDFWKEGAKWSWFMPWYSDHYTMVSTDWWKAAFALDYVITRDQVSYE